MEHAGREGLLQGEEILFQELAAATTLRVPNLKRQHPTNGKWSGLKAGAALDGVATIDDSSNKPQTLGNGKWRAVAGERGVEEARRAAKAHNKINNNNNNNSKGAVDEVRVNLDRPPVEGEVRVEIAADRRLNLVLAVEKETNKPINNRQGSITHSVFSAAGKVLFL